VCSVKFGNLLQQFVGLVRREPEVLDVLGAGAVFFEVVVAELRLDCVRAEQRVRHERTRQPASKYSASKYD